MLNLRLLYVSFLIFVSASAAFSYAKLDPILRSTDKAGWCRSFYYGGISAIRHQRNLIKDVERTQVERLLDARRAFYHYEKYSLKLSPETIQAIGIYKGIGYIEINRLLRSGKPLMSKPELASQIELIDRAIDQSPPLPSDVVLYRGIGLSDPSRISIEKGAEFSDAGFVSTSLAATTAFNFAGQNKKLPVLQVIHVRSKNIRGLYIEGQSFNAESEILLDRQTRFRVLRSQWVMVENISDVPMGIGTLPPIGEFPGGKLPLPPPVEKAPEQLELFPIVKNADPEQQELFPEIALPKQTQDANLDPYTQMFPVPPVDPSGFPGGLMLPSPMTPGVPNIFPGSSGSMSGSGFFTVTPEPFKMLIQHLEVIQD